MEELGIYERHDSNVGKIFCLVLKVKIDRYNVKKRAKTKDECI